MELTGRHATPQEIARMASPFNVNHGADWTPERVRDCVMLGGEAVEADPRLRRALEDGINLLVHDCAPGEQQ